jgi:hypothetical protein
MLEEYLRKLAGGDRQIIEGILRECYGDEYVAFILIVHKDPLRPRTRLRNIRARYPR